MGDLEKIIRNSIEDLTDSLRRIELKVEKIEKHSEEVVSCLERIEAIVDLAYKHIVY